MRTHSRRKKDARLVLAAQEGDRNAFEQLVDCYFGTIYAIGFARLGDRGAAEDLAQEVFLRAYLHLDNVDPPGQFGAWLCRIARNLAIDWLKHRRRASELIPMLESEGAPAEPRDERMAEPYEQAEAEETQQLVRDSILRLPAELREVVLLHYVEGLRKNEVAERLDVHPSTVGRQIERALARMKGMIGPVLRGSAPALRARRGAAGRTLGLIAAVFAMSAAKKVALAQAAGGIAKLAAGSAAASTAATSASTSIVAKGGSMLTAKVIISAVATVAVATGVATYKAAVEAPAVSEPQPAAVVEVEEPEESIFTDEEVTYAGVVTDEDGNPIEGARVRSAVTVLYFPEDSIVAEAVTHTDKDGRFTLGPLKQPDKKWAWRQLIFEHPDYAVAQDNPPERRWQKPRDIRAALRPPARVGGVVKDQDGKPVAGATVAAHGETQTRAGFQPGGDLSFHEGNGLEVQTDAGGRFVFDRVPQLSRFQFSVKAAGYADYHTQQVYPSHRYVVRAGDEEFEIVLELGAVVTGRLTLEGKPYRRKDLAVSCERATAFTDAEGRFELRGVTAGSCWVAVRDFALSDSELICVPQRDVEAKPGMPTDIELELRRGVAVSGRVVDEKTGEPANGVHVSARMAGARPLITDSATTDAEGRYEVRALPGECELKAYGWQAGYHKGVTKTIAVAADVPRRDVDLAVPATPKVRGRLVDVKGQSVQGTVQAGHREPVPTAEDGTFAVLPGYFHLDDRAIVRAFDKEQKRGWQGFWREKDAEKELRVIVQPLAGVTGRVLDEDFKPIGGAELQIEIPLRRDSGSASYAAAPWKSWSKADGTFAIEGIPLGLALTLRAQKEGYNSPHQDLVGMRPGETLDAGDIFLRPDSQVALDNPAALSGRVLNEKGEPVVGAQVYASGARDMTDWKGRFYLGRLPAGKALYVKVQCRGYGSEDLLAVETGRDDLEVYIYPLGYDLIGRPAPELNVGRWFNTEPLSLKELRGKVVVLALNCRIRQEIAWQVQMLQDAFEEHDDQGVVVICVNTSLESNRWPQPLTESEVEGLLKKHDIGMSFAIDAPVSEAKGFLPRGDQGAGATAAQYGIQWNSAIFLIDKKGILRKRVGVHQLTKGIEALLAE